MIPRRSNTASAVGEVPSRRKKFRFTHYIMHTYSKPGNVFQMSPVDYISYTIRKSLSTYDTRECSPDVPWRPQCAGKALLGQHCCYDEV